MQFNSLFHVNCLKLNFDVEKSYIIFFGDGNVSGTRKKWCKFGGKNKNDSKKYMY